MSESVIKAAARIEQNRALNGNHVKHQGKRLIEYANGIARDGKGNEVEVNPNSPISPFAYKFLFRMDDTPVTWDQIKQMDPMLRVTKGFFMLKYVPKNSPDRKKGRPWKIGQDIIRWDIRVAGPNHWHKLCKEVPELGWIERNSTLTDELFSFTARHAGMAVWFTVDWIKYDEKIRTQLGEGERIVQAHKSSVELYKQIKEVTDKDIVLRVFNDIIKEVNNAERDPTVQKEMEDFSGERYTRCRELERDPKTGRYVNKTNKEI